MCHLAARHQWHGSRRQRLRWLSPLHSSEPVQHVCRNARHKWIRRRAETPRPVCATTCEGRAAPIRENTPITAFRRRSWRRCRRPVTEEAQCHVFKVGGHRLCRALGRRHLWGLGEPRPQVRGRSGENGHVLRRAVLASGDPQIVLERQRTPIGFIANDHRIGTESVLIGQSGSLEDPVVGLPHGVATRASGHPVAKPHVTTRVKLCR